MTEHVMTDDEKRDRDRLLLKIRLRRALDEAPGLLAWVWSKRLRFGAERTSGTDTPLPFREKAFDDANAAYATLVNWSIRWASRMNERPPINAELAWNRPARTKSVEVREVLGFPDVTTVQFAASLTITVRSWLMLRVDRHLDLAMAKPDAGEEDLKLGAFAEQYADEVLWMLSHLRRTYGAGSGDYRHQAQYTRVCPICSAAAVEVSWYSDHTSDLIVQCHSCHANTMDLLAALGIGQRRYLKFLSWLDTGHHVDDAPPTLYDRKNAAHVALARRLGRTDLYLPPTSKQ